MQTRVMAALVNHELLNVQREEAFQRLGCAEIHQPPEEVSAIWRAVAPGDRLPIDELESVIEWLDENTTSGDLVWVQGDFGATVYVVDFCWKTGRHPLYATTRRKVQEERTPDGRVERKSVFQHVSFRYYKRWRENEREGWQGE